MIENVVGSVSEIKELLSKMVRLDRETKVNPITFVVEEGAEFIVEAYRYLCDSDTLYSNEKELIEEATDVIAASLSLLQSLDDKNDATDTLLGDRVDALVKTFTGEVCRSFDMADVFIWFALRDLACFNKIACKYAREKAPGLDSDIITATVDVLGTFVVLLVYFGLSIPDMLHSVTYKYKRALDRWYNHGEK